MAAQTQPCVAFLDRTSHDDLAAIHPVFCGTGRSFLSWAVWNGRSLDALQPLSEETSAFKRVVVKIMAPVGVPIVIRHLLFRVPQKGPIILTTTQKVEADGPGFDTMWAVPCGAMGV